jgi:hypothetical protein
VNSILFQNTTINDRFVSSCSLFSFFCSSWLYLYIKNVLQREKISMCLCLSFSNTITNNSHVNTQNAYKSKRTFHTLLCFIEAGLFTWGFFWVFSCFFLFCFVFCFSCFAFFCFLSWGCSRQYFDYYLDDTSKIRQVHLFASGLHLCES